MTTYSTDPALYIFTSLTAGSSHIITATSRLETILRANRVPFKAVDIAVDEKARMLWGRRAGKDEGGRMRKLPGLVQEGFVLGDIVEIEDWNEYGELKQHVKIYYDEHTIPSIHQKLPDPPLKKPIVGGSSSSASASAAKQAPAPVPAPAPAAAAASAGGAPAPPAPPLPETKATPASSTADKPKAAQPKKEEKTLPVRSVADEAAQKAKELRLKSLREKVHGKDGAKPGAEDKKETKPEEAREPAKTPTKKPSTSSTKNEGLQSPTSGSWAEIDAARNSIQSPTSGTWKHGRSGSVSSLKGATVAEASQEEIKAIEAETAIKEEPDRQGEAQRGGQEIGGCKCRRT
ncbi:hypothetical protein ACJZ2D_007315 [Fusarium nematophilum]